MILSGNGKIYFFDLEKFNEIKLYDVKFSSYKVFYLAGYSSQMIFTNFQIFNYFNLICRRSTFKRIMCHYDDVDDECTREDEVILFKFNEDYSILKEMKNFRVQNIYLNNNIIIEVNKNNVKIFDGN